MKSEKQYKCEGCNFPCPWIPVSDNSAARCPTWIRKQNEKRVLKMVELSGRTLDKCPRFDELNYKNAEREFTEGILKIRDIHTNINHLFFIFSNPGTGKTHTLLAYTLQLLSIGINAYYVTAARLRNVWLDYMNRYDLQEWEPNEIESIENSKTLIIDDFGREGYSLTGHFQKNLEGILTSFGKKIIFASNISFEDENFPYKDEEWIMDRLNSAVQISWMGESFRKPIEEKKK